MIALDVTMEHMQWLVIGFILLCLLVLNWELHH